MWINQLYVNPQLNEFFESIEVIKSTRFKELVPHTIGFPIASPEIVILLKGTLEVQYKSDRSTISNSCVFTFIDKPVYISPSNELHLIKIRLRPLGVYPLMLLTKIGATELISSPILKARELFGSSFDTLENQLIEEPNPYHLSGLLSSYFIPLLSQKKFGYFDEYFLKINQSSVYNVNDLCAELSCTPRTLQRWFVDRMNISPKFYLRLIRFKRILQEMESQPNIDYLQIALKYGLYDKNHLIKEIKFFTDYTPELLPTNNFLSI